VYRSDDNGLSFARVTDVPVTGEGVHVVLDTPPPSGTVLTYELRTVTGGGEETLSRVQVQIGTGVQADLALAASEPNPFTTSTVIHLSVPRAGHVRLAILDAAGRQVRVLRDGDMPAGSFAVTWDGRDNSGAPLPSGIYFQVAQAGGRSVMRRAVRVQ
jgi:hypothetical protein